MEDTVLVAIVGVGGTVLGAAIAPVTTLIRDIITERRDRRAVRLESCAALSQALILLAKDFDEDTTGAFALEMANDARFNLARHVPRGAGHVDRFVDHTIEHMTEIGNKSARETIAKHASSCLMEWARGDRNVRTLTKFEAVPVVGIGWEIV